MGMYSTIEWTQHTHNLWWGCVHCSPACDKCYADAWAHHQLPAGWLIVSGQGQATRRTKHGDPNRPEIWGADAPRIFPPMDGDYIMQPASWNKHAEKLSQRHRVFVMSMGDLFERHRFMAVNRAMDERRELFFRFIVPACPALDFLLLTKRPHDIMRLVPPTWRASWPSNVWVGTTVENQQCAERRLPHLIEIPAPVRFISAEPLLGSIDLTPWVNQIDWFIVGGESGAGARPSNIGWVRTMRDQVKAANRALFFKQWGIWAQRNGQGEQLVKLRTKDFRLLDGREWNELPIPQARS